MSILRESNIEDKRENQAVDFWFKQLRSVALYGLKKNYIPNEHLFCFREIKNSEGIFKEGKSFRYSAMVVIGYCSGNESINSPDFSIFEVCNRLIEWVQNGAEIGDSGLVLWALLNANHPDASSVVRSIENRKKRFIKDHRTLTTMSLGYLLAGLSESIRKNVETEMCISLAENVYNILVHRQCQLSGLFPLGGYVSRWKLLTRWARKELGSFASQVYPIVGLSLYSRAIGNIDALDAARKCLDTVCHLQGSNGQWWWIYNVSQGKVAIRYPVYSVHQDAMGPMAILSVQLAGGDSHDKNLNRSLSWFDKRPECQNEQLIREDLGIVWRAVQHDTHTKTGAFGLGKGERIRMLFKSITGGDDRKRFKNGWVCYECRPYHLGWILLAADWFRKCKDVK